MIADGIQPPIGREAELATIDDLLGSLGRSPTSLASPASPAATQLLLVAGDAGMGKTTLVRASVARAEALGHSCAEGHCLDLATGTAFAPVTEALRQVVASRRGGRDGIPRAARWLADDRLERGNALERLLGATSALAADQPMVLVLEDLHWSDRSTRDFALALTRTNRVPLLLVVTTRTDDLNELHPGRPAISELSRSPGAVRLDLGPLDPASIACIAHARSKRALDDRELASIVQRSAGNPLFAEEIVASAGDALPTSLHDLLLRHVKALTAPAAALVRLAAVGGAVIDVDLLGEAARIDSETFAGRFHEALTAGVFTRHGQQYAFRHALIRDAVDESLLPSERTDLHHVYVEALRRRAAVGTAAARWRANAALAVHATAAGDLSTALSAHVAAGLAGSRHGVPEAADNLEAALELWPAVPEAAARAGIDDAEVAVLAAGSLMRTTQFERIDRLLDEGRRRLREGTDPLAASRVLSQIAVSWGADALTAAERAVALAGERPSHELADAWGAMASVHYAGHHYLNGVEAASRSADIARRAGSLKAEADALTYASYCLHELGRFSEADAASAARAAVAERAGALANAYEARGDLAMSLTERGRYDEGCVEARRTESAAEREGLAWSSTFSGEREVKVLIARGRFDDARRRLDGLVSKGYAENRRRWTEVELLMATGELEQALTIEEVSVAENFAPPIFATADALRRVELFDRLGHVDRLLSTAVDVLAVDESESPIRSAVQARCGFQALAGAASRRAPAPDGLAESAASALGIARAGLSDEWSTSVFGLHLAIADAYAARTDGRPATDEWERAVAAAEPFGAYVLLRPVFECAREDLVHGRRDEGRERLVGLWRAAESMGSRWFSHQAVAEARRHRVPLPGVDREPGPRDRLTPREQEVLEVLAQGATNRTIAQTLFISEKTVGLHVSNILAKLGVSTRGEAAALARPARS